MKAIPEDAKILLNTLACAGHVATGLSEIKDRCDGGRTLRKQDVGNLELYVDTLNNIEDVGRRKVGHLCQDGSYVLTTYDMFASAERKKDEEDTRSSAPLFIRKLRQFRDACAKGLGKRRKNSQTPALSLPQTIRHARRDC